MIFSNDNDDLWNVPTDGVIPRDAKAMAKAVAAMLTNCSEIIFVDPHFEPRKSPPSPSF